MEKIKTSQKLQPNPLKPHLEKTIYSVGLML